MFSVSENINLLKVNAKKYEICPEQLTRLVQVLQTTVEKASQPFVTRK